jgi:hypothetical protein
VKQPGTVHGHEASKDSASDSEHTPKRELTSPTQDACQALSSCLSHQHREIANLLQVPESHNISVNDRSQSGCLGAECGVVRRYFQCDRDSELGMDAAIHITTAPATQHTANRVTAQGGVKREWKWGTLWRQHGAGQTQLNRAGIDELSQVAFIELAIHGQ